MYQQPPPQEFDFPPYFHIMPQLHSAALPQNQRICEHLRPQHRVLLEDVRTVQVSTNQRDN